jgi:2-oxoglutarate ferredoxin oxidoreductase subunit alpha
MTKLRQEKVDLIAQHIPELKIDQGLEKGDVLVIGWGSTYGSIKAAVTELLIDGHEIAHAHLIHLNPFPRNLEKMMGNFKKVIIPEINNGQLVKLIKAKYLVDAISYPKIQGIPLTSGELIEKFSEVIKSIKKEKAS